MNNICATPKYKDSPACSCINSKVIEKYNKVDPMFPLCPHIYDKQCINNGYKPTGLPSISCDYMNCSVNILSSKIESGANVQSECGKDNPTRDIPDNSKPANDNIFNLSFENMNNNMIIGIIAAIIFVIFIIIILVVI